MDIGNDVELIGVYYEDSYAETEPHKKAIGWSGLKLDRIIQGRAAPYLVVKNGSPIGWAPPSSVKKITQPTPITQTTQTQTQTQTQVKAEDEKFISVNFVSMGIQDIINYSVVCKLSWPFSEVEKKLYEDFPEYNKPQTFFTIGTNRIEKNKTLKENKIVKNSVITVFKSEV